MISLLLKHGANVNLQNKFGEICLHRVVEFGGDPVIVQQLLEHGAYANLKTTEGHTPISLAMKFLDNCPHDEDQQHVVELLRSWQKVVEVTKAERSAFCMAMHERVGADSSANLLSRYTFQEICSYLRPQMEDRAAEEYKQLCIQPRHQGQPQVTCTIQ